jgi:hypothetical protein
VNNSAKGAWGAVCPSLCFEKQTIGYLEAALKPLHLKSQKQIYKNVMKISILYCKLFMIFS